METRPPRVLSETRHPMVSPRFLTLVSTLLLAFTAALANAAQSPPPEAKRRFDVSVGDATQTLARGGDVLRIPGGLSFEEAATLPVVFM